MPCPWYRGGMCTSPKLSSPSSAVVSPERCLGGPEAYKSCSYYVEKETKRSSILEGLKPAIAQSLKPYLRIHLIDSRPHSGCPYMKVHEYSGGYLAECLVLNRLLTKSEVRTCEKYWKSCPLYKYAQQMGFQPR